MDSTEILRTFESERDLLADFIDLSQEHLMLLENENVPVVNSLWQQRADLMTELSSIEATLGTWISEIRRDRVVTAERLAQLNVVKDEIVGMAYHILHIDEQARNLWDSNSNRGGNVLRFRKR